MLNSEILIRLSEILLKNNKEFFHYKWEKELTELLELDKDIKSHDLDEIFKYVEKYLNYSIDTDNKMFLNRMWSWANKPSIIGDITSALTNTSACTYESAPVSTIMEKYTLNEIWSHIWFTNFDSQMTTWSSNANMLAMMIARNFYNKDIKTKWFLWSKPMFAFVNQESHYSLDKAANLLWIWTDNLIKISTYSDGSMNIEELEKQLIKFRELWICFMVVATAWTTVRWAYDSIERLLFLKQKYDFWLHVDWAWWWSAVFSEKLRNKCLYKIEEVNSFTFDFHKMLNSWLICNVFFINNNKWLLHNNCKSWTDDYIFNKQDEVDLGESSIQCGRKVDALKLFLDFKYYQIKWLWEKVEYYYDMIRYAEWIINNSSKLKLLYKASMFNLCFVYESDNDQNKLNKEIRDNLYKWEKAIIGSCTLDGQYFLRLLVANENVDKNSIDAFFKLFIETGDNILTKQND